MQHRRAMPLPAPGALGTGLVALDVVINGSTPDPPPSYAGGTCGNVLTVLSYLGWDTAPIARLSPGTPTDYLLADLSRWNVSTRFISVARGGSTPIIIHRISRTASGQPRHTFSWRCPGCGLHLPGYKPVLATAAQELAARLPAARVFFFDRVSRGTLELAQAVHHNSVIVFEPSSVGDPSLFREAWKLAHVVKYSHERLRDIADLDLSRAERDGVLLEVETLGQEGLRYRSRLPHATTRGWMKLGSFKPEVLQDAAGSGDWCTAGLLDKLARTGLRGFNSATTDRLRDALRYGQALAAWNCGFDGARGGMYEVSKEIFERQVRRLLGGNEAIASPDKPGLEAAAGAFQFCPSCTGSSASAGSSQRKHA
jgi:sugar/nucleoside kinase (ribokinase family)